MKNAVVALAVMVGIFGIGVVAAYASPTVMPNQNPLNQTYTQSVDSVTASINGVQTMIKASPSTTMLTCPSGVTCSFSMVAGAKTLTFHNAQRMKYSTQVCFTGTYTSNQYAVIIDGKVVIPGSTQTLENHTRCFLSNVVAGPFDAILPTLSPVGDMIFTVEQLTFLYPTGQSTLNTSFPVTVSYRDMDARIDYTYGVSVTTK